MIRNLILALAALFVALGIAEVTTRVYLAWVAPENVYRKYATLEQLQKRFEPRVVPHRYLGFYPNPEFVRGNDRHNSLGYRGDEFPQAKPDGEYRIVCLGGSTTYTLNVRDASQAYPALLEQELAERGFERIAVINAGVPGYSSWETLVNFQFRVLDLEPDMIIVYHGVNDIHPRLVWPPEAYRGDNSGRSGPFELQSQMDLADFSALARVLMIRTGRMQPEAAFANSIDIRPDTYYAEEFMWQKKDREYPSGVFSEVLASEMLETNSPRYFRRNLENLIALAELHDVQVVFATFAFSPRFRRRPRASSPEYVAAYKETNQVLRELAEATPAHLFDFAGVFPRRKDLFTDGRHVTRAGSILKAQLFADFLTENALLLGLPLNPDNPEP